MSYEVIITTENGTIREQIEALMDIKKLIIKYDKVYTGMRIINLDSKVKKKVKDNGNC